MSYISIYIDKKLDYMEAPMRYTRALLDYIQSDVSEPKQYTDYQESPFIIKPYNKNGLTGDYDGFYTLVHENGQECILTRNEKKLSGFVGFRNRIIG